MRIFIGSFSCEVEGILDIKAFDEEVKNSNILREMIVENLELFNSLLNSEIISPF